MTSLDLSVGGFVLKVYSNVSEVWDSSARCKRRRWSWKRFSSLIYGQQLPRLIWGRSHWPILCGRDNYTSITNPSRSGSSQARAENRVSALKPGSLTWCVQTGSDEETGGCKPSPEGGCSCSLHFRDNTHLIPHHVLPAFCLWCRVTHWIWFVCMCVRSPQQFGYLCRSGCVRADRRSLWTLCLFCFISPPPCWIHFMSCWHTAGSSVRALQVAGCWAA